MNKQSGGNVHLGFTVEVVQGDALAFPADVLVVKHSPNAGGLGAKVRNKLRDTQELDGLLPGAEEYRILPGKGVCACEYVLILGAPPTFSLLYPQLRDLGRRSLQALWHEGLSVRHVLTTNHGVRTGLRLDEVEAFRSLLLGLSDAYDAGEYPATLERVTFIEVEESRARLMQEALRDFLPAEPSPQDAEPEVAVAVMAGAQSFEPEFRKPESDETTPHIFVAMPFKNDYDDQFYLAIQPCVKDIEMLCERMDLDTFTGDIVDRMLDRIRTARLMVALLDGGNPNVYLEVGYAWGVKTPTVLIARKDEQLPFDIRGHRVLIYDKIYRLQRPVGR